MIYPHEGTFQEYTTVPDGMGGSTKEWSDVFTTECHVQPITGQERANARQLETSIDHKVFYPYNDGITSAMRLKWHDRQDSDGNSLVIDLKFDPIDQGGIGEILMVEGELK